MAVRIIVDSAADFEAEYVEKYDLKVVSLKTIIGETEYVEGVNLTREEFYEKLVETDDFPRTSQVSPFEFEQAFNEVIEAGDTAVVVTLSSKLSGTYESACIAAQGKEDHIAVVDSLSVTIGERILVERALAMREQGMSAHEIAAVLDEEKSDICVLAALDTLEYLKKGGRISSTVAFAGGLLSIKPVITVRDGEVAMVGTARGSKKVNNLLREMIAKEGGVDFGRPVRLGYTGLSDALLQKYVRDSEDLFKDNVDNLEHSLIGSVIGTHVGPGAIAVVFFRKNA